MGPIEKCLTVVRFRSGLLTAVRQGGSRGYQESAERFQALIAIAVDLSSSSKIKDASSGRHVTPAGCDLERG
jgi:hypothetical protein